jgi:cell division topological specificity factor
LLFSRHAVKASGQPELLNVLREEILAVVAKHINLDPDRVRISMDCGDPVSTLEVDIEIPNRFDMPKSGAA